jgi:SAM-dependent methyltransferase
MVKHLYNTRLGKVGWFIRRFGARELILKPLRVLFSPLIIPLLPAREFTFKGHEYRCFYHRYNMTWAGERMIEIPIAKSYLDLHAGKSILEIGNVLSHYYRVTHDIVDKYERGPCVINEDITDFDHGKRYDLIISISTFEHIGFDDDVDGSSGEKILLAIRACMRLLKPGGTLVITVPLGYNPDLDRLIGRSGLGFCAGFYLRRVGALTWKPATKAEGLRERYAERFFYANAILVAEFSASDGESLLV